MIGQQIPTQEMKSIWIQLIDQSNQKEISDAFVQLNNKTNSTLLKQVSDQNGIVAFKITKEHQYTYSVSSIGYGTILDLTLNTEKDTNTIELQSMNYELDEVIVKNDKDSINVSGNTTTYNTDLYKSQTDQQAKDLLEKLPGVEITENELKIDGEKVTAIQIDGKDYAGNSQKAALEQIPSDIISRIEVVDVISPDDPTEISKVINILSKKEEWFGFGRAIAFEGSDQRRRYAGNYYLKYDRHRFTLMSDHNNINKEDLLSDYLSSMYIGDNNFTGGGLYYSYNNEDKTDINLSLNFNQIASIFRSTSNESFYDQNASISSILNQTNERQSKNFLGSDFYLEQQLDSNIYLNTTQELYESNNQSLQFIYDTTNFNHSNPLLQSSSFVTQQSNLVYKSNTSLNFKDGKRMHLKLKHQMKMAQFEETDSLQQNEADALIFQESNQNKSPIHTQILEARYYSRFNKKGWQLSLKPLARRDQNKNTLNNFIAPTPNNFTRNGDQSLNNQLTKDKAKFSTTLVKQIKKGTARFDLSYEAWRFDAINHFTSDNTSNTFHALLPKFTYTFKLNRFTRTSFTIKQNQIAPRFDILNPSLVNNNNRFYTLGTTNIQPERLTQIDFKHKTTRNKRITHRLNIRYQEYQRFIAEDATIMEQDTNILNSLLKTGSRLTTYTTLSGKMNFDGTMNHEINRSKNKYGINYGYQIQLTPSLLNGENNLTHVNRYKARMYWNYYPNDKTTFSFRSGANYGVIQNTNNSNQLLNWHTNFFYKQLFFNRLLFDISLHSYEALLLNSKENNLTNQLNLSFKYALGQKQKNNIQLIVHDLLNSNLDISQSADLISVTTEEQLQLTRYILLGLVIIL